MYICSTKANNMTTLNNKLEAKVIESFISELGETPSQIRFDGDFVYADGFYCRILNGKSIKKTHGLAWRKEN
jgi:hypothetical protein